MSEVVASPRLPDEKPPSKAGSFAVLAAVIGIVAILFYLERLPEVLYWPLRLLFVLAVAWLVIALARKIRATKFEAKKVVFSILLAAMLYGALFVICLVFVKLMSAKDAQLRTIKTTELAEKSRRGVRGLLEGSTPSLYDREVGWVPRPGFQWKMHSISEQGFRGPRVYPETAPDPDQRILCVGDSFTFGYEVVDDQTYPHHGEQLAPGTEWINMGICGAGLTQALMHYRKTGRKFGGKYVVIGFMTSNNNRTVNCFRPFVSPEDPMTPLTKPFAKYSDGVFSFEPNPYQDISRYKDLLADEPEELRKLFKIDYLTWSNQKASANPVVRTLHYVWERRRGPRNLALLLNRPVDDSFGRIRPGDDPYGPALWNPQSLGFQAITRVFDTFYEDVTGDGRTPLFVIIPGAGDVERRAEGYPPKEATLLAHLEEKGYPYFDFLDSLEKHRPDRLTQKDLFVNTHFNGETNKLLAEEVIKALNLK